MERIRCSSFDHKDDGLDAMRCDAMRCDAVRCGTRVRTSERTNDDERTTAGRLQLNQKSVA